MDTRTQIKSTENNETTVWLRLPQDVISYFVSFLEFPTIRKLMLVGKIFRDIIYNREIVIPNFENKDDNNKSEEKKTTYRDLISKLCENKKNNLSITDQSITDENTSITLHLNLAFNTPHLPLETKNNIKKIKLIYPSVQDILFNDVDTQAEEHSFILDLYKKKSNKEDFAHWGKKINFFENLMDSNESDRDKQPVGLISAKLTKDELPRFLSDFHDKIESITTDVKLKFS